MFGSTLYNQARRPQRKNSGHTNLNALNTYGKHIKVLCAGQSGTVSAKSNVCKYNKKDLLKEAFVR